jgi:hypothetical protein
LEHIAADEVRVAAILRAVVGFGHGQLINGAKSTMTDLEVAHERQTGLAVEGDFS